MHKHLIKRGNLPCLNLSVHHSTSQKCSKLNGLRQAPLCGFKFRSVGIGTNWHQSGERLGTPRGVLHVQFLRRRLQPQRMVLPGSSVSSSAGSVRSASLSRKRLRMVGSLRPDSQLPTATSSAWPRPRRRATSAGLSRLCFSEYLS